MIRAFVIVLCFFSALSCGKQKILAAPAETIKYPAANNGISSLQCCRVAGYLTSRQSPNACKQSLGSLLAGINEYEASRPALLTDILYDKEAHISYPAVIHFVFNDGTAVDWELTFQPCRINDVYYCDFTGDGIGEVVVDRYFTNTAGEYTLLDIFQIDGKNIRQIFPNNDIPKLQNEACDANIISINQKGRKGIGLFVNTLDKEGARAYLKDAMKLFYEDGKWIMLEPDLQADVSLESAREEAGIYQAFLEGKRNAVTAMYYYYNAYSLEPISHWEGDFRFQDILNSLLYSPPKEDSSMDAIECALIDCEGDGKMELALRACFHDDGTVIMIFRCTNGQVELVSSIQSQIKSNSFIYPNNISLEENSGLTKHDSTGGPYWGFYENMFIDTINPQRFTGVNAYTPLNGEEIPVEFYHCMIDVNNDFYAFQIAENTPEDVKMHVRKYIRENRMYFDKALLPHWKLRELCNTRKESLLGIVKDTNITWQTINGCDEYLNKSKTPQQADGASNLQR